MFAVKHWPAAWRPMFERGDHVALMLPITPATPPRRSSDCSAASPTSWRTSPRPTTKFPRPFAPSAPTGASINRSRPTHRAHLHPRQALFALGPTRRVRPAPAGDLRQGGQRGPVGAEDDVVGEVLRILAA